MMGDGRQAGQIINCPVRHHEPPHALAGKRRRELLECRRGARPGVLAQPLVARVEPDCQPVTGDGLARTCDLPTTCGAGGGQADLARGRRRDWAAHHGAWRRSRCDQGPGARVQVRASARLADEVLHDGRPIGRRRCRAGPRQPKRQPGVRLHQLSGGSQQPALEADFGWLSSASWARSEASPACRSPRRRRAPPTDGW
jgi:hypothetical protein